MYDVMHKYDIAHFYPDLAASVFFPRPHPVYSTLITYSSGYMLPLHFHDYPQLWYCKSGRYIHYTESGSHECTSGSIIIIPPGCPNKITVPEGSVAEIGCISFNTPFFSDISFALYPNTVANLFLPNFSDAFLFNFYDFAKLNPETEHKVNIFFSAIAELDPDAETIDLHAFYKLLEEIFSSDPFRLPAEFLSVAATLAETKVFPIIRTLIYINCNFAKKLTAAECAKIAHLCKTNFFKTFHTYTGAPFSEYLKQLRVVHASILSGMSPFSLTYVASLCGYSDAAHMSNSIKKYTGRTPRAQKQRMHQYYARMHEEGNRGYTFNELLSAYMD
ncbi:MAG: helix-turn-helix transcriptional regulator [Ruminococcaceae bacterium]|nr:helix-turn-helix transcriptional regulator [Oscillospiraceae bacterium]